MDSNTHLDWRHLNISLSYTEANVIIHNKCFIVHTVCNDPNKVSNSEQILHQWEAQHVKRSLCNLFLMHILPFYNTHRRVWIEVYKYLGVLFMSEGRTDREISRWICVASAVVKTLYWSVVVKWELARLYIHRLIYIPIPHLWFWNVGSDQKNKMADSAHDGWIDACESTEQDWKTQNRVNKLEKLFVVKHKLRRKHPEKWKRGAQVQCWHLGLLE